MESLVRSLAKSVKYQTIYCHAKEGSLKLFHNAGFYTNYQVLFINYLSMYNSLYTDIALEQISEIVLEDEIYEDAYLYYKRINKLGSSREIDLDKKKKDSEQKIDSFSWVMKKPKGQKNNG